IRIVWQQARMALRDVEHDRPRLEQAEIAFFVGRNLPERMKRQMCGFLHGPERNKTNLVRLAHFLQRPANARITRQSLAAIGRPFKGGNRDGHRETPPWRNHRLRRRPLQPWPTLAMERERRASSPSA